MKFSIIVAAYNVEPYIADCVDALKRQTFSDFEVLMVDDASSDDTLAVAKRHAGDDARFTFFEQPHNAGQSATRNVGLDHAVGEFVLFLDSDDYYRDDALAVIVERLEADNLDQLLFAAESFYENRRLRRERYEDQEARTSVEGVMTGPEMFVALEQVKSFRPSACLFALKRALIEDAGLRFKEGVIHEDLLFTMQATPLPQRTAFLNEPLYQRRMREGSTMTSAFSMRNVDGLFQVAQVMRAWIHEQGGEYSQDFRDAYAARVFDTYQIAARYLFEIPETDVEAYRVTLTAQDRLDFDMQVLELFRAIKDVYDEMTGSRTYRLGRVFMAFPSWAKSRLVMPKAKAE